MTDSSEKQAPQAGERAAVATPPPGSGHGVVIAILAVIIVAGIVIGIAGALAVTQFLAGLLFEVKPADGISYISVTLLIGATALLACLLPARRALRVDPVTALREA